MSGCTHRNEHQQVVEVPEVGEEEQRLPGQGQAAHADAHLNNRTNTAEHDAQSSGEQVRRNTAEHDAQCSGEQKKNQSQRSARQWL